MPLQNGTIPQFSTEKGLTDSLQPAKICHTESHMENTHIELTPKLLGALYTEAMLLADEARSYFDRDPAENGMAARVAVSFSCESLKVTTRLMHSIAWLLAQKALHAGEITDEEAQSEARQLGYAPASDDIALPTFPIEAQILIRSSEDLYYRLQRMGNGLADQTYVQPAPHRMLEEIRSAF